jgi:hypothetical protein
VLLHVCFAQGLLGFVQWRAQGQNSGIVCSLSLDLSTKHVSVTRCSCFDNQAGELRELDLRVTADVAAMAAAAARPMTKHDVTLLKCVAQCISDLWVQRHTLAYCGILLRMALVHT